MTRGRTNQRLTTIVRADGTTSRDPDELAVEEPLEIRLDGHLVGTTMRTPGHDFELAVGFCHGEGLLGGVAVRTVKYCRDAGPESVMASEFNVVTVDTGGTAPTPEPRLGIMTSACGVCGSTTVDDLLTRIHPVPPAPDLPIGVVVQAPTRLLGRTEVFAATGAVHAAVLFDRSGRGVVAREDVGRHNAVDKIVGHLLLQGRLPATGLGLAVSGRVGYEIVQKAAAAGVGTIVAKGAPTTLAVEAARLAHVSLLGWATGDQARRF